MDSPGFPWNGNVVNPFFYDLDNDDTLVDVGLPWKCA
jgi:hypothetical protein